VDTLGRCTGMSSQHNPGLEGIDRNGRLRGCKLVLCPSVAFVPRLLPRFGNSVLSTRHGLYLYHKHGLHYGLLMLALSMGLHGRNSVLSLPLLLLIRVGIGILAARLRRITPHHVPNASATLLAASPTRGATVCSWLRAGKHEGNALPCITCFASYARPWRK
jgi:hypothetical protein